MSEHEHGPEDHICLADLVTREDLTEDELAELERGSGDALVATAEDAEASADVSTDAEAQGITVRHDWRTANYGPYPMEYPIGIMLHHTAGSRRGDLPILTRRGTGVSANAYITKDGTIFVLAPFPRRAWHAGRPDRGTGYTTDGNKYYYGIEIENLGDGRDPYTKIQVDAIVAHCRWVANHHGITHPRAMIRHRDFAPSRKIDTSDNFPFLNVRNRVFAGKAPSPDPPDSGSGQKMTRWEWCQDNSAPAPVTLTYDGKGEWKIERVHANPDRLPEMTRWQWCQDNSAPAPVVLTYEGAPAWKVERA